MKFERKSAGSVEIITCIGKLDIHHAAQARLQLNRWIDQGRKRLLFNLENVAWIDSSGLATLVNILQKARSLGGDIALLKPRSEIETMLRSARLHSILRVFDDEQAAVKAISG